MDVIPTIFILLLIGVFLLGILAGAVIINYMDTVYLEKQIRKTKKEIHINQEEDKKWNR